jgi:hypothetical protein
VPDKEQKSTFSYSILKERSSSTISNDSLKKELRNWIRQNPETSIEDLTDHILEMTADQLNFSFGKCSSDPDKLVTERKANCIGYSSFFNSLMEQAFAELKWTKRYNCKHYVGKIWMGKQNINALFKNPFFKDHDFNIINDLQDNSQIAVDPSLYEYLGVQRVSVRK